MDLKIAGKRALVLGASRGLGAAIAAALAAEGVLVTAAARNIEKIDRTANIEPVQLDLSNAAAIAAFTKDLVDRGGIDILVNNGGGPKPAAAFGLEASQWLSNFETMAASLFSITNALLPQMIERKWGRIITVGSSGIVQPIPNLALSNGIRSAVASWSKTLSGEVAGHGITVNMLLPGRIATDRVRELDEGAATRAGATLDQVEERSRATIPAGRYGRPEEFGAAAAFLASDLAGYITGSMLRVDGGSIKSL